MKYVLGHKTSHHVVFVGPLGVGKTTAVRAISDIPVLNTDEIGTREMDAQQNPDKHTTTVGFDYGEWRFPDGARVSLIGVPGQERFDAMWDALLPQSSAIVLWLYGDRPQAYSDCRFWLEALSKRGAMGRLAVAVTRLPPDTPDAVLDRFREQITPYHPLAPLITADPRDPSSVIQAVMVALSTPYCPIKR